MLHEWEELLTWLDNRKTSTEEAINHYDYTSTAFSHGYIDAIEDVMRRVEKLVTELKDNYFAAEEATWG